MKGFSRVRIVLLAVILLVAVLAQGSGGTAVSVQAAAVNQPPTPSGIRAESRPVILRAGYNPNIPAFVPPPESYLRPSRVKTATITVNYIGSWDAPAQTAFQYAVDIWETMINSSVPIVVDADWSNLGTGILGGAGANNLWRDFNNAPVSSTWYPAATANALAGYDLDAGTIYDGAEIGASFNKNFTDWYFGTDGNPPSNKYDFVSVVLHEIGHGLGFAGSMTVDDGNGGNGAECNNVFGNGCWGRGSGRPFIYDRFTENGGGQSLINTALFGNPSTSLGNQLQSGNIFFDGTNARAANGGNAPRLYAPGSWQQGSSYSHLDESAFGPGNVNSLMTPVINNGEANHNPGPITMGIFQDTGWTTATNTDPTISGLPDQTVPMNTSSNNAIDLWAYTTDGQDEDAQLTFTISNSPDANAGVSIDSNRYIDITPTTDWEGSATVTIQVTDSGGLTDTDSFLVTVANTPPEFTSAPGILMEKDGTNDQAVDLWAITTDLQTAVSSLTFTLPNAGDANAGASINANQYVSISPNPGWTGQTTITIRAADPDGGETDLNINVVIAAKIFNVYLPIIQRN